MEFTDFPPCKHRFGCVQCRNDAKFVEHMKSRFGDWECPEGIPFGTPPEQMPEHIQNKIKSYQNKIESSGRSIPKTEEKNQIANPLNRQIKSFTETPACKHRMACVDCRNNEKFRERMEDQLGKWECPENIPINTPLSEMPRHIIEVHEKRQEQIKAQKEKMNQIRIALDSIEEVVPEQALGLVDVVRSHLFPDTKKASLCVFNTQQAKKVEKKCCGGKIKMVDGFLCEKHGDTMDTKCAACPDFKRKR